MGRRRVKIISKASFSALPFGNTPLIPGRPSPLGMVGWGTRPSSPGCMLIPVPESARLGTEKGQVHGQGLGWTMGPDLGAEQPSRAGIHWRRAVLPGPWRRTEAGRSLCWGLGTRSGLLAGRGRAQAGARRSAAGLRAAFCTLQVSSGLLRELRRRTPSKSPGITPVRQPRLPEVIPASDVGASFPASPRACALTHAHVHDAHSDTHSQTRTHPDTPRDTWERSDHLKKVVIGSVVWVYLCRHVSVNLSTLNFYRFLRNPTSFSSSPPARPSTGISSYRLSSTVWVRASKF